VSPALESHGRRNGSGMTDLTPGRLLGCMERERRSSGRGRARVQDHAVLGCRVEGVERLRTATVMELGAEGPG
jgi:hypothetical protein